MAAVDATAEREVGGRFEIKGYPTGKNGSMVIFYLSAASGHTSFMSLDPLLWSHLSRTFIVCGKPGSDWKSDSPAKCFTVILMSVENTWNLLFIVVLLFK